MRSPFGWDLPPGCTHRMIEEQCQDSPCAVCGMDPADCVCPECKVCGETGNPLCYLPLETGPGHGMRLNKEQAISRQKARIFVMKNSIQDEEQYLQQITDSEQTDYDITEVPDIWS